LWCADYKGEFRLGNHTYCYPLTVTDQASRFLLLCEARVPFASANALFNLSKLAVWWQRLGIAIEQERFDDFRQEFNCERPMRRWP
jgi:hypothetical protein